MDLLSPVRKLARRKTWSSVLDNAGRATGVGNYWYWLDTPELAEGIDIASLVCPLRYDVLVRRDFLAFYAAHRDLYIADFDAFVDLAKQGSYYIWYMQSEVVRCKRDLLGNEESLEAGFVDRIRAAAALYEAMRERDLVRKFPIILKTAEQLLPPTTDKSGPPTGKVVSARYFLADGCHRLAFLMAMGYTVLPTIYFRVKCFREFSPFDSTSLLVRSLPINQSTYFAFLSSYYCAPFVFEQREAFLRYISEKRPEFWQEVLSVIHVDGFDNSN